MPLFLVLLFSCKGLEGGKDARRAIVRFDKLQYEYVEFGSFDAMRSMNTVYLPMYKLLVEDVLELGTVSGDNTNVAFKEFFSDSTLIRLGNDVEEKFDDLSGLEENLDAAFRRLEREVPGIELPVVYTQLSALNESIVVGDSVLGISLDKYMGENYPLYKLFYYPYQRRAMNPDRILHDCVFAFLRSEFPFRRGNAYDLADFIVYNGILEFVTSKLTGENFSNTMGYTPSEEEWCLRNEKGVAQYMVANGHFHSKDFMVLRRYLRNAPFTAFFGNDSPSRVGVWIGMRIVEAYMKNNREVSFANLLSTPDYHSIIEGSNYFR